MGLFGKKRDAVTADDLPDEEVKVAAELGISLDDGPPQQALFVHLPLPDGPGTDRTPYYDVQGPIQRAVEGSHLGEFDGDKWTEEECVLACYGRDAEALLARVRPLLTEAGLTGDDAYAELRDGLPGRKRTTTRRIPLPFDDDGQ